MRIERFTEVRRVKVICNKTFHARDFGDRNVFACKNRDPGFHETRNEVAARLDVLLHLCIYAMECFGELHSVFEHLVTRLSPVGRVRARQMTEIWSDGVPGANTVYMDVS